MGPIANDSSAHAGIVLPYHPFFSGPQLGSNGGKTELTVFAPAAPAFPSTVCITITINYDTRNTINHSSLH